ncbi:SRPBCC family protein [Noviherbaspirillum aridicola]|uniref:Coenzyme Q-binding protein COQ10 START domain-containing protein n=1 Tax=Noviherbaspirillum aridicola TaxID=2849687 RepID=A0ABQ4Q6F9_9BURK|nr:SRPBCC family protein [Noviherbaspirillum aridicola]GIZ52797.1 hypothetical protein NCCP691_28110 [Noviherbaspirillum aridicola]
MSTIRHSIEVRVPAHQAWQQLARFELYPQFMEDVEAVQKLDDTHLHWTTRMANRSVEWDAEITEQEPGRCLAWHNTSGPTNNGRVDLEPLGNDQSKVTITLHAEPEQVPGNMSGYTEQEMAQRLGQDMARLKDIIEGGRQSSPPGAAQAAPIPMRHLGEMPQDTTAEVHGSVPTSDAIGRPAAAMNAVAEPPPQPELPQRAQAAPAAQGGTAPQAASMPRQDAGGDVRDRQLTAGNAAVAGAAGGTDAAAGARMTGGKGGGGTGPRHADAQDLTGAAGGSLEGDRVSPAAGADAAGGTGLGSAVSAGDTRTGTGTSSGSGTALTGGGASGGRDAGIGGGGSTEP